MTLPYLIYLLTSVALFAILALSFNLLAGFTGLTNLGHTGLFLIGAYTAVLLQTILGMPLPLAWLLGTVAGLLAGGLLSVLTKRSRGDAVAIMALWFLFVVVIVALQWFSLTRGALGIPGIPRPALFAAPPQFFLLSLISLATVYGLLHRITTSPFGRVLGAVRDDELGAATLGKNVFKARVIAFLIAGAIAGFGGALFGAFYRFIDPTSFYITQLVALLAITYVGGLASLPGTLAGAALIVLLPEALRFLPFNPEVVGALRQILFSALVLVVILWRPRGMLGKVEL